MLVSGTALAFSGVARHCPEKRHPSGFDTPLTSPRIPVTPRPRTAFTLIELLVVVVIIGILAAIAIPKFQNTKGRANAAALKSDLRNLAVAQEAYFFTSAAYASDTALLNFRPSPGVILTLSTPGVGEWVATATHPLSYPLQCVVFYGAVSPTPTPATVEGVPACQ